MSNHKPIEKVLQALGEYKPAGDGQYRANCPAHGGAKKSLAITEGRDGTVLLKCWSKGCPAREIVESLDLEMSDLFVGVNSADELRRRESNGDHQPPEVVPYSPPVVNESQNVYDSLDSLRESFHNAEHVYVYHNWNGDEVAAVIRATNGRGKMFIQCRRQGEGWIKKGLSGKKPLYHLGQCRDSKYTFVVEGEKCVESAESIGLIATTSMGGSKGAKGTDWSPLAGKRVIIAPDNDAPGRHYFSDGFMIGHVESFLSHA